VHGLFSPRRRSGSVGSDGAPAASYRHGPRRGWHGRVRRRRNGANPLTRARAFVALVVTVRVSVHGRVASVRRRRAQRRRVVRRAHARQRSTRWGLRGSGSETRGSAASASATQRTSAPARRDRERRCRDVFRRAHENVSLASGLGRAERSGCGRAQSRSGNDYEEG
jgi:hypothetical protein